MIIRILFLLISVRGEFQECYSDLVTLSTRFLNFTDTDHFSLLARYSGRKINDLGDYKHCIKLEHSDYVLFRLSPSAELYLALCGPDSCSMQDYEFIISTLINSTHLLPFKLLQNTTDSIVTLKSDHRKVTKSGIEIIFPEGYISGIFSDAIVVLSFWALLVLLSLLGTFTDLIILKQEQIIASYHKTNPSIFEPSDSYISVHDSEPANPHFFFKFLRCFSLFTNIKKLFTSRSLEKTGSFQALDILNSVRVISLCWIIFGHVFMLRVVYTALANPEDSLDWIKEARGVLVYGAFYAVDVFFWLSGFLLAYMFLLECDRKERVEWTILYFHRVYRILPAYAMVLFSTWKLIKYAGDGPIWYRADSINAQCEDYWWTNLTFLNNFIPNGDGNRCFGWGWYLANDMQFFLISPLVLFIYHRSSKVIGWCIFTLLILTDILTNAFISYYNNIPVGGFKSEDKNNMLYIKPYCRIAPYAIGVLFGMLYFTYRKHHNESRIYDMISYKILKLFHCRYLRYLFYILGLGLISFMLFMEYPAYSTAAKSDSLEDDWSQTARSAFMALDRSGFVLGVGLILMPLMMGYNKLVGEVMSSKVWTPLARLSFCGYLVHLSTIAIIFGRQEVAYYLSDFNLLVDFIIGCIGTYAIAFLVSILVESPLMNLEKLFRD
jgi:peptidoglycan/LPS O-acetylase OafA/YrhL